MPASSLFWLSWQGCICDLCHPFSGIGGKSGTTLPFSPVHHSRPLRNLQSQGPCDSWEGISGAGAHQNTATGFLWKQHEYFSLWILLVVVRVARLQHTQWLLGCLCLSSSSMLELQQWCCLATSRKAVLVQVLRVNLNPCCQRKQTSRCCRGHIAGLP